MVTGARPLRSRLSLTLVGLGLASVVLLASANYFVIRDLLNETGAAQLTALRDVRRDSLERRVQAQLDRVAMIAADPGISGALRALDAGYNRLDNNDIEDQQLANLKATYNEEVAPYDEAGVPRPSTDELIPASNAGQRLQHLYVSGVDPVVRPVVSDAGDGSVYSAAHSRYHVYLSGLADSLGATDLLLVSAVNDEVVYSTAKHIDIGTDVTEGPYLTTGLGDVVTALSSSDAVAALSSSDAVIADSQFYLPAGGEPVMHIAATVRSGRAVLGTMVVELPIDGLTTLIDSDEDSNLLGLGETGDVYLVGADRQLRTVPRLWFEDREEYLERFADTGGEARTATLMQFRGSPVLLQPANTEAVTRAQEGADFEGITDNYLGQTTRASATSVDIPGLDWVVVAEQAAGEARDDVERFVLSILLLIAIWLPILAFAGIYLARMLARPVEPLVEAASSIAVGHFDTEVPDLGHNELGDLGRQLRAVAEQPRADELELEAEERRIDTMLSSVLPPDVTDRVRSGEYDVGETLAIGTVVALRIDGLPPPVGVNQDTVVELTGRISDEIRRLSSEHGVERVRLASDRHLLVAGRAEQGPAVGRAVEFSRAVVESLAAVTAEVGVDVTVHVGLAAGTVAMGVLGSNQVSYGVWGESTSLAIELSDKASRGEILADSIVATEIPDGWESTPADDDVDSAEPLAFRLEASAS